MFSISGFALQHKETNEKYKKPYDFAMSLSFGLASSHHIER